MSVKILYLIGLRAPLNFAISSDRNLLPGKTEKKPALRIPGPSKKIKEGN